MYTIKMEVDISEVDDIVINDDIRIKDHILYLKTEYGQYKFEKTLWHYLKDDQWVAMQYGVPDYSIESENNPCESVFEKIEN